MKRFVMILMAIGLTSGMTLMAAMSTSRVRRDTRFLTDKMAYELKLSPAQYDDVYEINYDFINSIRYVMDNVMYGEEWALNDYYRYLDIRNDDLRWVLNSSQYRRFLQTDYFYRPVYATGGGWNFRIYITYTNPNLFYFGKPRHYRTYCGGHYRTHYNNVSYYRGRYNHPLYSRSHSVRDNRVFHTNRRSDFGSVRIRPNTTQRPSTPARPATSTNRVNNSIRRETPTTTPSRRVNSSSSSRKENATTTVPNRTNSSNSSSTSSRRETTTSSRSNRPNSSTSARRSNDSSSRSGSSVRSGNSSRSGSARSSSSRVESKTSSRENRSSGSSRSSSSRSSSRSSHTDSSKTSESSRSSSSRR